MATYEEMREKGFTDVWGYGGEYSELKRLCIGERFILLGVYQSIEDILTANDKTPILIKGKIGQGYENEFLLYEIGKKRETEKTNDNNNALYHLYICLYRYKCSKGRNDTADGFIMLYTAIL